MHDDHHHHDCGCGCGGSTPAPSPETLGVDWSLASPDEVVCPCAGVTKGQILAAMDQGASTLPLLKIMTGAGRERESVCRQKNPRGRSCQGDLLALLALQGHASGSSCG